MSDRSSPETSSLTFTIRFVQGYRYLDRCGEALIRLEEVLDDGWIPAEPTPSGGVLRNYKLGMLAQFQSELMTLRQSEFISFEHFRDQTCKVYEILWNTFDIGRVFTPVLRVVLQIGFESIDSANQFVRDLEFCVPTERVLGLLGGDPNATSFTLCTESTSTWQDVSVVQRRRLELRAVRQEKQPDFDERIMRRLPLIPLRQREPIGALMKFRRQHPATPPFAAQFDLENSLESTEFPSDTFDVPKFIDKSWEWAEPFMKSLTH